MTHPATPPAGDAARSLDLLLREHIWNDHPWLVLGGEKFEPIGAEEVPGCEAAEHAVLLRRQSDGQIFEAAIGVTIRPARSGKTGDPAGGQVQLLTYGEAVALLPGGDTIHTYFDDGTAIVNADWDRAQVLALLETASRREVSGPAAQRTGHGLAACRPDGVPVFIETRKRDHAGQQAREGITCMGWDNLGSGGCVQ